MALYEKEKKGVSMFEITKQMAGWKKDEEMAWLSEVNSQALQSSLRHLDAAYTRFFREKKGFPKFKSKYDRQSFCNVQGTKIENGGVFIPKFKGGIKAVIHREFKGEIKSSAVSRTPTGKYYISILVEEPINNPAPPKLQEDKTLGIDLGIKTYATFSDGTKIENPKHLKKRLRQLRKASRLHSRKKKGSNNREKARHKLAVIYSKVSNSRRDFLHKLTSGIVKNQDYTSIAIEDLSVRDMLNSKKNKKTKLARHIADAGWGEFRNFLTYKCERAGKNLLVIGRFEPSSRLCTCGYYNHDLSLKDREWTCPKCEVFHDRDILAARNIKKFALCSQNTESIGRESPEFTLGETSVGKSGNQEATMALA